jgi:predicted house-cleaning noncanonical NTP pyrophosphatase (MazG superfamily)
MAQMRSPNYPSIGLTDAVTLTRKLWDKEKRTPVTSELAAKAIGYKSLSGPARTTLAAMKKFGLLEDTKQGVSVSPLALRILHPASEEERLKALREAALRPELFRQLTEKHLEASDDALRSHLITTLDFSETGAKTFIDSFRDTMRFAKVEQNGYSPQEKTPETQAVSTIEIDTSRQGPQTVHEVFRWPLPNGVQAELRMIGGQLTEKNVDALSAYLETVKRILRASQK